MMIRLIAALVVAALCLPGTMGAVRWQTPESVADSAELALNTALGAAQLNADQVTEVRSEYEIDDGKAKYEVEFRNGDWEYEYTVDAETGEVLEADKDFDPPAKPEKPVVSEPAPQRLTADQAKVIALADAGVSEAEAIRLRAEFDFDDGTAEWEIEFELGQWEYEYEINADTGEIISRERDD